MIKIIDLKKTYKTNKIESNTVIEGFNLEISSKGMVFILGKSGSGKTTLLNLIGGLDDYDGGEILVNGKSTKDFTASDFDSYRKYVIGFIFQEHNVLIGFTVEKNLSIALELQGKTVSKNDILDALKQVEMAEFIDRYPNELSTGQKQRVAIARALVNSPEIILADEPTGSLDSETGVIVLNELKKISKDKLVIVITHDRDSALKYGDRVVEIADGKITNDTYINDKIKDSTNMKSTIELNSDKTKMSYKDILKLSYTNLIAKRTRLIFTIVLSTIAFTFFGVADTISSYDKNTALLHSLYEDEREYIFLSKESREYDSNLVDFRRQHISFNSEDDQSLSDYDYYSVFYNYEGNYFDLVDNDKYYEYEHSSTSYTKYYTLDINGSTEISEKMLTDLNIDLISGRLPVENESDNEIVISKFTYDSFAEFGMIQDDTEIEINSMEEILGKTFRDFVIVGIVDTKLNEERYELLDDNAGYDEDTIRDISLEYQQVNQYGLQTLIYFREGYYNDVIDSQDIINFGNVSIEIVTDSDYFNLGEVNSGELFSTFDEDIYWINNHSTELSDFEVIIPFDMLPKFGTAGRGIIDTYESIENMILAEIDSSIEEFALSYFTEIKVDFEQDFGVSTYSDYTNYIINNTINEYHVDKDYAYFQDEARKKILEEVIFDELNGNERMDFNNFGNLGGDFDISVVGVYFPENPQVESYQDDFILNNPLILSQSLFNYLDEDIGSVIVVLSDNTSQDLSLIEMGEDNESEGEIPVDYILQSDFKIMIDHAGGYITFISVILLSVGGFFAIFAGLLLYNFISTSIRYKQKDIGILRSIGASSNDVFKIFFFESIMVALICYVLALTLTIPITMIFDNILQKEFFVPVSFVFVGFRQVALLFIISVFVALIATIVPIFSFSKKKPIDIIKNVL